MSDLSQAVMSFEKAVQASEGLQLGQAHAGLGTVLADQEQYPKALQQFERSHKVYESLGNNYYTVYGKYNIADMLISLGRLQEAEQIIVDAEQTIEREKIAEPTLQAKFTLLKAKIVLGQQNFPEAINIVKRVTLLKEPRSPRSITGYLDAPRHRRTETKALVPVLNGLKRLGYARCPKRQHGKTRVGRSLFESRGK